MPSSARKKTRNSGEYKAAYDSISEELAKEGGDRGMPCFLEAKLNEVISSSARAGRSGKKLSTAVQPSSERQGTQLRACSLAESTELQVLETEGIGMCAR